MKKREIEFDTGRTYGKIKIEIFEDEYSSTVYVGRFWLHSLPKDLTDREAEIAVRGFVEGHKYGIGQIKHPEHALLQIARHQYEKAHQK